MKYLIIPDIHHKTHVADLILDMREKEVDYVIFLGDYFDDFGDNPEIAAQTARWLKESLQNSKRIHLIGNHDLVYMYPQPATFCTGYTKSKDMMIDSILSKSDWKKLKWFHLEKNGNWLFSHAGLHPDIFSALHKESEIPFDEKNAVEKLNGSILDAEIALELEDYHPFYAVGRARGGMSVAGGLTWLDWNKEFVPFVFNQVVGHTPTREPRVIHGNRKRAMYNISYVEFLTKKIKNFDTISYNIDTHLRNYAIVDDCDIKVFDI